jgi:hypothetical protein
MLAYGSQKSPLIFLDHGIVSGLFLLQYTVLYTVIKENIQGGIPNFSENVKSYIKKFNKYNKEALDKYNFEFSSDMCYEKIIWATYAAALHNFLLTEDLWPRNYREGDKMQQRQLEYFLNGKLRIADDPLAYLGIIVDILQEWDRYSVSGDSAIGGPIPIQGKDIKLEFDSSQDLITLQYPINQHFDKERQKKRNNDIKKKLSEVLENVKEGDKFVIVDDFLKVIFED